MSRGITRRALIETGIAGTACLLFGCGTETDNGTASSAEEAGNESPVSNQAEEPPEESPSSNDAAQAAASAALVVYYSRADENYSGGGTEWLEVGHTKVMAGFIAEALGADTYEIVPQEAYPEGYDDCCDVALQEQSADARPAIANELPDVSPYDTIFIGCPIWWGDEPMIVRTFVESVSLAGKTIVPFTTHGGSGLGSVPHNLQQLIPEATFLDGHAVAGTAVNDSRDEIVAWASSLA